jgi:hypothetical protein
MAKNTKRGESEPLTIEDEPGMAERFQRGLQRAFQMPHKPHPSKAKERPAASKHVHKGKTGR